MKYSETLHPWENDDFLLESAYRPHMYISYRCSCKRSCMLCLFLSEKDVIHVYTLNERQTCFFFLLLLVIFASIMMFQCLLDDVFFSFYSPPKWYAGRIAESSHNYTWTIYTCTTISSHSVWHSPPGMVYVCLLFVCLLFIFFLSFFFVCLLFIFVLKPAVILAHLFW